MRFVLTLDLQCNSSALQISFYGSDNRCCYHGTTKGLAHAIGDAPIALRSNHREKVVTAFSQSVNVHELIMIFARHFEGKDDTEDGGRNTNEEKCIHEDQKNRWCHKDK